MAQPDQKVPAKQVFQGQITPEDVDVHDGGTALVCHLTEDDPASEATEGMFVRLHSWHSDKQHPEIQPYLGRHIRITIETID